MPISKKQLQVSVIKSNRSSTNVGTSVVSIKKNTAGPIIGPARPLRRHKGRLGHKGRLARIDLFSGLTLIAPQAIGFLIFVLVPVVGVMAVSLFEWNIISGKIVPAGLGNYTEGLADDMRLPEILRNTVLFILGFMPLTVLGGLALAVVTNRSAPGMSVFRAIYFLPVVISLAAWAMVWRILLQQEGAVNAGLSFFGIQGPNWLSSTEFAMVAVILVASLKTMGFTMILFHAALQNIPRDVIEAARIDGANQWAQFRFITLPMIAPFTFLVVILVTINSFKTFALFFVLTNGGPGDATRTLSFYIYDIGFRFFELGYASTLSVVLFVAVFILTLVQFLARRKWVHVEN